MTVEGMCDEREDGPDADFVNSRTRARRRNEGELGGNPTPTPEAEVPDTAAAGRRTRFRRWS